MFLILPVRRLPILYAMHKETLDTYGAGLKMTYDLHDSPRLQKFDIYGSSRVGMQMKDSIVGGVGCTPAARNRNKFFNCPIK